MMTDQRTTGEDEKVVLGTVLYDPALLTTITAVLTDEDFLVPAHRAIWRAFHAILDTGDPLNALTVQERVVAEGLRIDALAVQELHEWCLSPDPSTLRFHADRVAEAARLRAIEGVGVHAMQAARSSEDSATALQTVRERLDAVVRPTAGRPVIAADLLTETLNALEHPEDRDPGIRTGWVDLDEYLLGAYPGQFLVVGSRPSVGKSAFAINWARNVTAGRQGEVTPGGVPTLLFSLEMSRREVSDRLLAMTAQIDLTSIVTGQLNDREWDRVGTAMGALADAPLWVDDGEDLNLSRLRATIAEHQRSDRPVELVIVDYLQLMQPPKADSRRESIEALTRGLKLLAKQMHVPIVALAQLNRESSERKGEVPRMSDLRESGTLEQDADVVLLLHRDELVNPETQRLGELDVIIAKQRQGRTGTVPLGFHAQHARIVNHAGRWQL